MMFIRVVYWVGTNYHNSGNGIFYGFDIELVFCFVSFLAFLIAVSAVARDAHLKGFNAPTASPLS